jgi:outer membrane protein insertion porin family
VVPEGNEAFVGGRFFSIFTYEVSFPVAPPTVYGLFFFDAGNTWNSFQGADLSNLRRGAGIGIRIELPMLGTVGMDYGYGFDRGYGRFRFAGWEPHITFGGAF